jgi:hypothetical protein
VADLAGVWEKVYQADRHMTSLEETLNAVYSEASATIRLVRDTETDDYCAVLPAVPSLPPRIGAIIGDICHNLRSALDHLAYQLVLFPRVDSGEPKTAENAIQFPIFLKESKYNDSGISGADTRAKAVIRFRQPFGDPNHVLWLLHELNNRDKHRLLLVIAHQMTPGVLDASLFEQVWLRDPGPAVDNAQLARFRFPTGYEPDVDVGLYVSFVITFADGPASGMNAWMFLREAVRAVPSIVNELAQFVAE